MKYRITLLLAALMTGCTGLQAPKVENSHLYLLDAKPAIHPASAKIDRVLAVTVPNAWPGFDTPQMAYQRVPHELEYFALHRWADTPAQMLKPLLARALEPEFRAIVQAPGSASADLRLDTELIRLQQDFTTQPSRVEIVLRAQLIRDKRVMATKQFNESEAAASDDPYGGVVAANRALQRILEQIADFCRHAATP